ncbi:MAG: hypothetical protein KatS3mg114_0795 [Planctomycetaceae bacterium]|nr:MAG: hypothetical protein KatS3mg114_0795 [Planctomycetaceae bacterium]
MRQTVFSLLAILLFCSAVPADDEYLLRVDTIGYIDSPEEFPKEIVLHSIDVLARPNQAFHSQVKIGSETLIISGRLHPVDGEFRVQIGFTHSVDTGTVVHGEPILNESSVKTTVVVAAGKSVDIGFSTSTADVITDKTEISRVKSKKRCVLFLSEYQPAAE